MVRSLTSTAMDTVTSGHSSLLFVANRGVDSGLIVLGIVLCLALFVWVCAALIAEYSRYAPPRGRDQFHWSWK
jgi:hypothetical protein